MAAAAGSTTAAGRFQEAYDAARQDMVSHGITQLSVNSDEEFTDMMATRILNMLSSRWRVVDDSVVRSSRKMRHIWLSAHVGIRAAIEAIEVSERLQEPLRQPDNSATLRSLNAVIQISKQANLPSSDTIKGLALDVYDRTLQEKVYPADAAYAAAYGAAAAEGLAAAAVASCRAIEARQNARNSDEDEPATETLNFARNLVQPAEENATLLENCARIRAEEINRERVGIKEYR
ncbi:MAG: hypothetical protein HZB76_01740 [Chlamydiae bacterium]|nr:hypothetical protein [Chlamydiota bacterium]